ncbi:hypothetical protein ES288_A04G039500v1 [Gossypium darwinii]|uniref:Leucine-rich repeat-containing N-terminal plant-type domain-containing protein n=1 Tax=Gossypium darwinii TaxID=34276 RepID=A0A5D2GUT9_GOSDA|nr:hypothetical protein ES288_A04G039500v1 [Gossypium darwinii]
MLGLYLIPSLLKLHHLTSLNFNRNDFNGSLIPEFFGSLKNLKLLDLSNANFRGPIPSLLGNLSMLETLRLGGNGGDITFRHNFKKINNLVSLNLSNNQLKVLLLAGNSFDGDVLFEAHFSYLIYLKVLDLSYTSLTLKFNSGWIPPFQLNQIKLCSCKLGPHFPDWIRTQVGTQTPYLDTRFVDYLNVSASGISDSLAYWFWDSSYSSMYINMSFNQISGTFPNNSIRIRLLDLSSNNFSGPLPYFSLDLGNMGTINLSKNKFTGSISLICNITDEGILKLIDLLNNLFSGVVPDCFESFQSLTSLNLGDNGFSGSLPSSLGSLTSLEMLSLRGNNFLGELPSSLQNCTRLKFLDLSDNELSGEIPIWIGQRLSSGRIPHQLCGLKYLQILDLSVNKISGTIPPCLNNLTSMAKKESVDRRIEHHILYNGLVRFFQVRYVDEALLTWKGTKQSYPQLGLLLAIDLSSNKLTREIGHLMKLEVLDLSRNKFSGNIPTSLSKLTFLSTLDLSYNDLSGKIPTSTQLQSFDPSSFSHNRVGLCGPPVSPNCSMVEPSPGKPAVGGEEDSDEFMKWFYTGMGLGFARSRRHSYYRCLDNAKDWVYVSFVLLKARLVRKIKAFQQVV